MKKLQHDVSHFPAYAFPFGSFSSLPPLKASEKSSTKFKLTPSETGPKHLLVSFSCDKFAHIKAFKMVKVTD